MIELGFTFIAGAILGAVGFALILKNNPKLQKMFNLVSDKTEKILEDKLDTDL